MDPQTTQLSQHIAIAFFKFDHYVAAAADFDRGVRVAKGGGFRPVSPEDIANDAENLDGVRHSQHQAQEVWTEIWAQLDDARAIAHRMARDTTMYDETRALSRQYGSGATLEVGPWKHEGGTVYSRSIAHQLGPSELVEHAMAVLLAAVPEAEIPKVDNQEVPDLGGSKVGLRVIAAVAIALVVGLVVAWLKTKG